MYLVMQETQAQPYTEGLIKMQAAKKKRKKKKISCVSQEENKKNKGDDRKRKGEGKFCQREERGRAQHARAAPLQPWQKQVIPWMALRQSLIHTGPISAYIFFCISAPLPVSGRESEWMKGRG